MSYQSWLLFFYLPTVLVASSISWSKQISLVDMTKLSIMTSFILPSIDATASFDLVLQRWCITFKGMHPYLSMFLSYLSKKKKILVCFFLVLPGNLTRSSPNLNVGYHHFIAITTWHSVSESMVSYTLHRIFFLLFFILFF